jgi:hypothetical protein
MHASLIRNAGAAIAAALVSLPVQASTLIYDSLGPNPVIAGGGWWSGGPSDITTAFLFATRTNSGYLSEISVALGPYYPCPCTGDYRYGITLYAHDAGNFTPGAPLVSVPVAIDRFADPAVVTAAFTTSVFLDARTLYWVGVEPIGGAWAAWSYSPLGTIGTRAHFGLDFYGDVWSVYPNSNAPGYSVSVTALAPPVPLPGAAWLLAGALGALRWLASGRRTGASP